MLTSLLWWQVSFDGDCLTRKGVSVQGNWWYWGVEQQCVSLCTARGKLALSHGIVCPSTVSLGLASKLAKPHTAIFWIFWGHIIRAHRRFWHDGLGLYCGQSLSNREGGNVTREGDTVNWESPIKSLANEPVSWHVSDWNWRYPPNWSEAAAAFDNWLRDKWQGLSDKV